MNEEYVDNLIMSYEGVVDCDKYRDGFLKGLTLDDTVMTEIRNAMDECKKNGLDGCLTLSDGPDSKTSRCTCDVYYMQYIKPLNMKKDTCKKMTKVKRDKLHGDFQKHEHWSQIWAKSQATQSLMDNMMADMFLTNNKTKPPNKENVDKNNESKICLCSKDKCNNPQKSSSAHAIGNAFLCFMAIVTLIVSIF